ncbi:MAG: PEP-CTERM sorting domain-containing protein [Syntrophaceae bacterium]
MKKVLALFIVFMFVFTSNLIASPLMVENIATFGAAGITQSGNGSATLLGYAGDTVNEIERAGDYVTWFQQLFLDPPAQPGTIKATLDIMLADDASDKCFPMEWAYIFTDGSWLPVIDETINGTESHTLNVCLGNNLGVHVTVGSLCGDFSIDKSVLSAIYTPVAPVPEPASLLLLGMGMLSAGFFARKKNKNS